MADKHFVTAIAAGYDHSLALTNKGKVIVWGANRFGFPQTNRNHKPKEFCYSNETFKAISAESTTSLFLTQSGKVIVSGFVGENKIQEFLLPMGLRTTSMYVLRKNYINKARYPYEACSWVIIKGHVDEEKMVYTSFISNDFLVVNKQAKTSCVEMMIKKADCWAIQVMINLVDSKKKRN